MVEEKLRDLPGYRIVYVCLGLMLAGIGANQARGQGGAACVRTISADVVALDQAFFWNRLGAAQPQGMIFALLEDVVPLQGSVVSAGNVRLRNGKRPRPLVLRMNVGDCLQINFQNMLSPTPVTLAQPSTRSASVHVTGLQLVNSIVDDGSNVGQNPSSLVAAGGSATYTYFADREGPLVLYSTAANVGGGGGGQLNAGLFGAVNVEPAGAEWYRSQVSRADIDLATIGTATDGHPLIDYDAVFPAGHALAGRPIFKILSSSLQIRHSDLTAIITGTGRADFPLGTYPVNPVYPNRDQSFREFTIIYHGEVESSPAFPEFLNPVLKHTLKSVRDAFAINYGSAGIGAEILANRKGVGPTNDCTECKYEEFFLSSWSVGDPAMVVDIPANSDTLPGPKATMALYPDDPSNVYHSYIGDHVKQRILHGGGTEHHIHHLHAHQWLYSADSDDSAYLDSQAIGPGASFTLEISYNGSGNRNKVVGDSIFHCHFYPHFAQGMWSLWRTHDVFENGTLLDVNGRPAAGSRALPDGEIATGTPIPAVVPIPGLVMPPMPGAVTEIVQVAGIPGGQVLITGAGNPGYPFFIPGFAGHRSPHPPMDTTVTGGLPRHVVTGGTSSHVETRLDFSKDLLTLQVNELPETGTAVEVAAMDYHALRLHPSFTTDGTAGNYVLNGLPAAPGAPYADPCVDDAGNSIGTSRVYKAADIQVDAILNKAGWHFPQTRLTTLQEDVAATLSGLKAPEPLFFRANTDDCIQYELTNLVPNVYELDDFQVRTPTDILGQHIHLVKFDVTSSDGSANGWNYEDGSFSPDEVRERIAAIRAQNGCIVGDLRDNTIVCPIAQAHPFFGSGTGGKWMGAQTTVQRWYADDVLNNVGQDRTLRTVFTHDHFGPSTHQQAGLYAGLVVEPRSSVWRNSESGEILGTRGDGGPTSFRADVLTLDPANSYREFLLEFADFQLAYQAGGTGFPDPSRAIGATALDAADVCPGGAAPPCPEAVSNNGKGTVSVNYRNEPMGAILAGTVVGTTRTLEGRLVDPVASAIALGDAGDVSHAYRSILRADPVFNVQPTIYPPLTADVQPTDPFTPMLRAYENDNVQVRVLIGAHAMLHNFSMHGVNWLFEPSNKNSGYRNSQVMGISEHFEFLFKVPPLDGPEASADYLYLPGASTTDQKNGLWGIMRAYDGGVTLRSDLLTLPNNLAGSALPANPLDFNGVCPTTAPIRHYNVTAVAAAQALPGGTLVYNSRVGNGGQIHDPAGLLYVRSEDLDVSGMLITGVPVEPLVLRAAAGECIEVTLTNAFDVAAVPFVGARAASTVVGLHPQLVALDPLSDDGFNIGTNPVQTVLPGGSRTYHWYAGNIVVNPDGTRQGVPVEFGATNLMPSDVTEQVAKGLIGALIIEPLGSTWLEDGNSRASATVTKTDGTNFREFVVIFQDEILVEPDLTFGPKPFTTAINYRTEPMWKRLPFNPDSASPQQVGSLDFGDSLTNAKVGADPETPVFVAPAGAAVRFRVLNPGGKVEHVFELHGHSWQDEPYTNNSTVIGNNPLSDHRGARMGHGPSNHFDVVLENGAGGQFGVPGDYLYRTAVATEFQAGSWGLFRVACSTNIDCDDSLFCNGSEICVSGACQAGTPIDCDDGIPCSTDSCDNATMLCTHTANDATCDDGVACNGAETCDVALGCVPGGLTCPGLVTTSLAAGRTPVDLVNSIAGFVGIGKPVVTNVAYTGAGTAAGTFNGGTGVLGSFESGIILSTGNIASVSGPNTSDSRITNQGTPGDSDLNLLTGGVTSDASVLEFDFECPGAPAGSSITFSYVFASDTYNELVGTGTAPAFSVFLNGQNVALLSDGITPMSIDTVNCGNPFNAPSGGVNCSQFVNNDCSDLSTGVFPCIGNRDTEMDGLTVPLRLLSTTQIGVNHLKIAIADGSNLMADSNVFILAGSLECVRLNQPPLPSSLKTIPVPEPDNLMSFVKNKDAAIRLGKSFFWDMQSGGDGITACATCHFHAGADARIRNTLNPGANGVANVGGPNYTLKATDFPFSSAILPLEADDIVGSQGVVRTDFTAIVPGGVVDDGVPVLDSYHQVSGVNTRRVTGRNTPSVINAVFNVRNFWDGRANFVFNGVSPFGLRDLNNPKILEVQPDGSVLPVSVLLEKSSLASQAMAPPNNLVEMSWNGRTFPELGRKLLSLQPLARQQVDPTDSVLGALTTVSGRGLNTTYDTMIKAAFLDKYWSDQQLTPAGFTQMEANFSLFWGLAIQTYESTLVSDDSPFDRFREGDINALSVQEQRGFELFVDPTVALCALCHIGAELSGASQSHLLLLGRFEQEILEPMIMGDGIAAVYDTGFYNIGVRPTTEDLGDGGTDPFGNPLSFTKLRQQSILVGPPFGVFEPFVDPLQRVAVDGSFKVPILRNVELTPPYMHNGGMDTLEQVVEFYTRGGDFPDVNINNLAPLITVLPLTALDRAAIVAFLKSLTDERVRIEAAPFDHPQLFVPHGHVGDDVTVVSNGQGAAADCLIEIPAVGAMGAAPTPLSTACMLACGNGLLEVGEACDDGNMLDGDCCSSTCQLAPVGAPCPGSACVANVCDATGTCVFSANVTGPCADGLPCSSGGTCQAGVCQPGPGLCVNVCEQCNLTTNTCDRCVFDQNLNGVMDGLDFAFFSGCFGGCYSPIDPCVDANYDQDVNNCVGGGDFAAFSGCFGLACEACGLCFPSSSGLMAGGAISATSRMAGPVVSVVLVPVAMATDGDFADELPTPSLTFHPGQHFDVEVWASLSEGYTEGGLASVYADVNYDRNLLVPKDVQATESFSTFSRTVVGSQGVDVVSLGGCAAVGDDTMGVSSSWVRVATLRMIAVKSGRTTLSMQPSEAPFGVSLYGRFGDLPQAQLSYEPATVELIVDVDGGKIIRRIPTKQSRVDVNIRGFGSD